MIVNGNLEIVNSGMSKSAKVSSKCDSNNTHSIITVEKEQ